MAYLTSIWKALFGGIGDGGRKYCRNHFIGTESVHNCCSGVKPEFGSNIGRYPVSAGRYSFVTPEYSILLPLLIMAIALINFTPFTHAAAATLNVDGGAQSCSDSTGTPYCKIQAAINDAADGDSVLVAPGTYLENLDFLGKAITVKSDQGAAVTIIDGGAADTVAYFGNGETTATVLDGFTLRNGKASSGPLASWGSGGGVCIANASPTIKNNVITGNVADSPGFGIEIDDGSPIIDGNTISNNRCTGNLTGGGGGGGIRIGGASTAQIINNTITNNSVRPCFRYGGGIGMNAAGSPLIRNNLISENASIEGGGIGMSNSSNPLIIQNVIRDNSATDEGGGIYWLVPSGDPGPKVVNNTIINNFSPAGSGVYADGYDELTELTNNIIVASSGEEAVHCGDFNDLNMPVINSNNIYSESGQAYSGICTDQTGINGNISADPLFVDVSALNFRLMPDSPAIGAGDSGDPNLPATDFLGNTRIVGSEVDMGAYEFYPNPGYIEFSAVAYSVGEADISATITVMRKAGRTGTVTVTLTSSDVSATTGADYTAVSETVTFEDGDMADKSVTVSILDDAIDESMIEHVSLELSNPTGGATLGSINTAELTIVDDELTAIADWSPEEGDNVCFIMTVVH